VAEAITNMAKVEVDGAGPALSRLHGPPSSVPAGNQRVNVSVRSVARPLVSSALIVICVVPGGT
jgi:hypothetical protein